MADFSPPQDCPDFRPSVHREPTENGTVPLQIQTLFFLWKAFPGVAKRQVVRGIPQEIVDRLLQAGGTSGHAEGAGGLEYVHQDGAEDAGKSHQPG